MLRPLPPSRFSSFVAAVTEAYAADNVAVGRWDAASAADMAAKEFQQLLPDGIATPDHVFYEIIDAAGSAGAGYVWFGAVQRGVRRMAYLYQLLVLPAFRRQGKARAALMALETIAREGGFDGLLLNVFASNDAARALYRSAGFAVTVISMQKLWTDTPPG